MSKKRTIPLKMLASALILAMLGQESAWAAPRAAELRGGAVASGQNGRLPALGFTVPASAGFVDGGFAVSANATTVDAASVGRGTGERLVILLQDAHTNPSAQLNAARIIAEAARSGQIARSGRTGRPDQPGRIRTVYVEGGSGDLTLSALIPADADEAARTRVRRTAESLVRKGRLAGFEYADLANPGSVRLVGVEDDALYDEAFALYHGAAADRNGAGIFLSRTERAAATLAEVWWSEELSGLWDAKVAHDNGDLPTVEYFERLTAAGAKRGVRMSGLGQLKLLRQITRDEQRFKGPELEEQMARAVSAFREVMTGRGIDAVEPASGADPGQLGAFWLAVRESTGIVRPGSALDRYISHLERTRQLDASGVLSELENYGSLALRTAAADTRARTLLEARTNLAVLRNIIELKATPADFAKYQTSRAAHAPERITALLNGGIHELGRSYDQAIFLSKDYERAEDTARKFYERSAQREAAMIRSMLDRMDADGETAAILVAGGFHAPGLARELVSRGVSYVSIIPAATHETDPEMYERSLSARAMPASRNAAPGAVGPIRSTLIPKPVLAAARRNNPDAHNVLNELGLAPAWDEAYSEGHSYGRAIKEKAKAKAVDAPRLEALIAEAEEYLEPNKPGKPAKPARAREFYAGMLAGLKSIGARMSSGSTKEPSSANRWRLEEGVEWESRRTPGNGNEPDLGELIAQLRHESESIGSWKDYQEWAAGDRPEGVSSNRRAAEGVADHARKGQRFVELISDADGEPVGFAAWRLLESGEPSEAFLDMLYVVRRSQRQGAGKVLLEHVIKSAKKAGARRIALISSSQARPFYADYFKDRYAFTYFFSLFEVDLAADQPIAKSHPLRAILQRAFVEKSREVERQSMRDLFKQLRQGERVQFVSEYEKNPIWGRVEKDPQGSAERSRLVLEGPFSEEDAKFATSQVIWGDWDLKVYRPDGTLRMAYDPLNNTIHPFNPEEERRWPALAARMAASGRGPDWSRSMERIARVLSRMRRSIGLVLRDIKYRFWDATQSDIDPYLTDSMIIDNLPIEEPMDEQLARSIGSALEEVVWPEKPIDQSGPVQLYEGRDWIELNPERASWVLSAVEHESRSDISWAEHVKEESVRNPTRLLRYKFYNVLNIEMVRDRSRRLVIARDPDGEIAGFDIWRLPNDEFPSQAMAEMIGLYVRRSFQEKGIGGILMTHVINETIKARAKELGWTSSQGAEKFYTGKLEKLGIRFTHTPWDGGFIAHLTTHPGWSAGELYPEDKNGARMANDKARRHDTPWSPDAMTDVSVMWKKIQPYINERTLPNSVKELKILRAVVNIGSSEEPVVSWRRLAKEAGGREVISIAILIRDTLDTVREKFKSGSAAEKISGRSKPWKMEKVKLEVDKKIALLQAAGKSRVNMRKPRSISDTPSVILKRLGMTLNELSKLTVGELQQKMRDIRHKEFVGMMVQELFKSKQGLADLPYPGEKGWMYLNPLKSLGESGLSYGIFIKRYDPKTKSYQKYIYEKSSINYSDGLQFRKVGPKAELLDSERIRLKELRNTIFYNPTKGARMADEPSGSVSSADEWQMTVKRLWPDAAPRVTHLAMNQLNYVQVIDHKNRFAVLGDYLYVDMSEWENRKDDLAPLADRIIVTNMARGIAAAEILGAIFLQANRERIKDKIVFDAGSLSGRYAILALKLGARRVIMAENKESFRDRARDNMIASGLSFEERAEFVTNLKELNPALEVDVVLSHLPNNGQYPGLLEPVQWNHVLAASLRPQSFFVLEFTFPQTGYAARFNAEFFTKGWLLKDEFIHSAGDGTSQTLFYHPQNAVLPKGLRSVDLELDLGNSGLLPDEAEAIFKQTKLLEKTLDRIHGIRKKRTDIRRVQVRSYSEVGRVRQVFLVTVEFKDDLTPAKTFILKVTRAPADTDYFTLAHEMKNFYVNRRIGRRSSVIQYYGSGDHRRIAVAGPWYEGVPFERVRDDQEAQIAVVMEVLGIWNQTGEAHLSDLHQMQFVMMRQSDGKWKAQLIDKGHTKYNSRGPYPIKLAEQDGELIPISSDADLEHLSQWVGYTDETGIINALLDDIAAEPPSVALKRDEWPDPDDEMLGRVRAYRYRMNSDAVVEGARRVFGLEGARYFFNRFFLSRERRGTKWEIYEAIRRLYPEMMRDGLPYPATALRPVLAEAVEGGWRAVVALPPAPNVNQSLIIEGRGSQIEISTGTFSGKRTGFVGPEIPGGRRVRTIEDLAEMEPILGRVASLAVPTTDSADLKKVIENLAREAEERIESKDVHWAQRYGDALRGYLRWARTSVSGARMAGWESWAPPVALVAFMLAAAVAAIVVKESITMVVAATVRWVRARLKGWLSADDRAQTASEQTEDGNDLADIPRVWDSREEEIAYWISAPAQVRLPESELDLGKGLHRHDGRKLLDLNQDNKVAVAAAMHATFRASNGVESWPDYVKRVMETTIGQGGFYEEIQGYRTKIKHINHRKNYFIEFVSHETSGVVAFSEWLHTESSTQKKGRSSLRATISMFHVAQTHQGLGAGKALMNQIIESANKKGVVELYWQTSLLGASFYAHYLKNLWPFRYVNSHFIVTLRDSFGHTSVLDPQRREEQIKEANSITAKERNQLHRILKQLTPGRGVRIEAEGRPPLSGTVVGGTFDPQRGAFGGLIKFDQNMDENQEKLVARWLSVVGEAIVYTYDPSSPGDIERHGSRMSGQSELERALDRMADASRKIAEVVNTGTIAVVETRDPSTGSVTSEQMTPLSWLGVHQTSSELTRLMLVNLQMKDPGTPAEKAERVKDVVRSWNSWSIRNHLGGSVEEMPSATAAEEFERLGKKFEELGDLFGILANEYSDPKNFPHKLPASPMFAGWDAMAAEVLTKQSPVVVSRPALGSFFLYRALDIHKDAPGISEKVAKFVNAAREYAEAAKIVSEHAKQIALLPGMDEPLLPAALPMKTDLGKIHEEVANQPGLGALIDLGGKPLTQDERDWFMRVAAALLGHKVVELNIASDVPIDDRPIELAVAELKNSNGMTYEHLQNGKPGYGVIGIYRGGKVKETEKDKFELMVGQTTLFKGTIDELIKTFKELRNDGSAPGSTPAEVAAAGIVRFEADLSAAFERMSAWEGPASDEDPIWAVHVMADELLPARVGHDSGLVGDDRLRDLHLRILLATLKAVTRKSHNRIRFTVDPSGLNGNEQFLIRDLSRNLAVNYDPAMNIPVKSLEEVKAAKSPQHPQDLREVPVLWAGTQRAGTQTVGRQGAGLGLPTKVQDWVNIGFAPEADTLQPYGAALITMIDLQRVANFKKNTSTAPSPRSFSPSTPHRAIMALLLGGPNPLNAEEYELLIKRYVGADGADPFGSSAAFLNVTLGRAPRSTLQNLIPIPLRAGARLAQLSKALRAVETMA